jgi:putative membrane protein
VSYGVGYVELLIFSLLPIVVMFVLLYLVIKWAVSSALRNISSTFRDAFTASRTAREILDERYARGEIGREKYEQVRRDIQAE